MKIWDLTRNCEKIIKLLGFIKIINFIIIINIIKRIFSCSLSLFISVSIHSPLSSLYKPKDWVQTLTFGAVIHVTRAYVKIFHP